MNQSHRAAPFFDEVNRNATARIEMGRGYMEPSPLDTATNVSNTGYFVWPTRGDYAYRDYDAGGFVKCSGRGGKEAHRSRLSFYEADRNVTARIEMGRDCVSLEPSPLDTAANVS